MKWSKYPTLGGDQDTLIDVSSEKYATRFSTGSGAENGNKSGSEKNRKKSWTKLLVELL